MFTGIIEELGEVVSIEEIGDSSRIRLRGPVVCQGAHHGDSIAVNGVCLTVVDTPEQLATDSGEFTADVMAETLHRSSLGALRTGSRSTWSGPWRSAPGSAVTWCRVMSTPPGPC